MTTAIIAEDEPHILAQLTSLLAELWPDLNVVAAAPDGVTALAAIRAHEPDVLFLDVKMPGLSGVEVLQAAGQGAAPSCATVFITAFDDFAVTAFDVGAVDYVVKPITAARLAKAITRVQEKLLMTRGGATELALGSDRSRIRSARTHSCQQRYCCVGCKPPRATAYFSSPSTKCCSFSQTANTPASSPKTAKLSSANRSNHCLKSSIHSSSCRFIVAR